MAPPHPSWRVCALALTLPLPLALAACHHAQQSERGPVGAPQREDGGADPGAPVLAAILNARAAIAAGDQVAALNDVNLALGDTVRLAGAPSALYPPESAPPGYRDNSGGGGGGGGSRSGGRHRHGGGQSSPPATSSSPAAAPPQPPPPAPQAAAGDARHPGGRRHRHAGGSAPPEVASATASIAAPASGGRGERGAPGGPAIVSSFDVQVGLVSALARLQAHDAAGADALLKSLAAASPGRMPLELPLIRADQSLALASGAVSGGRPGELRTQLAAARAALEAYDGRAHAAEAKATAREIGAALAGPGSLASLQPAQVALWTARADGWLGVGDV